jgi:allantoin racemase
MDTVSDSGLYALRSRLQIPVVGPGLVAFHVAATLGKRFAILTLWERWIHHYDKVLDAYGIRSKCASIRALALEPNLAALDAHTLFGAKGDELLEQLAFEAGRAIEDDGADAIVLGSTTMAAAASYLSERLPVPVVNPGPVALKLTEALVALGLSHSKVAFPSPLKLQDEKLGLAPGAGGAVWRLRSHD